QIRSGEAFYRAESCPGRDLAVLAAALHRERTGCLRVLDVMAGSGMRGARYFSQADADEVWINDGSTDLHDAMVYNMSERDRPPGSSARRIRISHADANRLLTSCYMRELYYDVVDVDSFGSETMHFPAAIDAVRYGGLLYLTSTDGFTSSGKRPARGLAAYGTYARATPWANEQGLRMIIGAAVREAAARGVTLTPVFSLYSYHGPVFRVMLRATRSAEWHVRHYGFMGHCFVHGDNYTVSWPDLGTATCRCETRGRRPAPGTGTPLVLAGPLWTGPLHDKAELRAMAKEAARRGWAGFGLDETAAPHLQNRDLLEVLIEEADPRLPPGFFSIDASVARRLARPPPRDALITVLRQEGFAAARCHL
ncbi:hypothetical protein VOLCADRAFT_42766, partial [Volvox carteri f. nagariensis]